MQKAQLCVGEPDKAANEARYELAALCISISCNQLHNWILCITGIDAAYKLQNISGNPA